MATQAVSTRTPVDQLWPDYIDDTPLDPFDNVSLEYLDDVVLGDTPSDPVAEAHNARVLDRLFPSVPYPVKHAFIGDYTGRPIAHVAEGKTPEGLARALDVIHVGVRYNTRAQREEYLRANDLRRPGKSDEWTPLTDRSSAKLRAIIAGLCTYPTRREPKTPLAFGRETWTDGINAMLYNREIDPFVEWLESLPELDGMRRLDAWLPMLFDIDEDALPLAYWAARAIPLGAVWRAYRPGTKIDSTVVLVGSGGIGKSSVIRYLLPPTRQSEWFSDSLRFDTDVKVQTEALQNRVIVEASEMQGSTRGEIGNMKSFLSRTDDGSIRLAFRRNPEPSPRRCVIVGTTDKQTSLPNDPNNRRFVPVTLRRRTNLADIIEYMDAERSQLWAEAVHDYRLGETAHLPDYLETMQAHAIEGARYREPGLEDAIDTFLEQTTDSFKTSDFLTQIGLANNPHEATKASGTSQAKAAFRCLRVRGCENTAVKVNGKTVRRWVRHK